MCQSGQPHSPLAVGVDLGGTWMRVVGLRDGRIVRRVRAATGLPQLSKFLPTHLGGRARPDSLVVAARGVWTDRERRAARRRLRGAAARVAVISDVEAALLGALGERPGVLVLAGTGSIVLGRDARGRLARRRRARARPASSRGVPTRSRASPRWRRPCSRGRGAAIVVPA